MDGEYIVHVHATLGDEKGNIKGGHLSLAHVFSAEIMFWELEEKLTRTFDQDTGLNLLRLINQ